MKTFGKVTGPKVDKWFVKTVGVLIGVVGIALIIAFARREISLEMAAAAAEFVLILGWIFFCLA